MHLKRRLSLAALGTSALLATGGLAMAQGIPRELPPDDFAGAQFVDSAGCVFVRVGVGGAVQWVPRVGRDRQQICGQRPSFAAADTQQPVAPAPDENTVIIGAAPVATPAPAPAPAPEIGAAQSAAVARPSPPPTAPVVTAPAAVQTATSCPGTGGIAARILRGPDVRCGPQAVHPGNAVRRVEQGGAGVPNQAAVDFPAVPEGFRPVYDDDRLNPLRGPRTAQGDAQMAQVWTNQVPRQPVEAAPRLRQEAVSSRSVAPRARSAIAPDQAGAAPVLRVPSNHRSILAATFATRAEADQAYATLAASGLPMRLGRIERDTGAVFAVISGPFASTEDLVAGLRSTFAAGFTQATTLR